MNWFGLIMDIYLLEKLVFSWYFSTIINIWWIILKIWFLPLDVESCIEISRLEAERDSLKRKIDEQAKEITNLSEDQIYGNLRKIYRLKSAPAGPITDSTGKISFILKFLNLFFIVSSFFFFDIQCSTYLSNYAQ